MFEVTGSAAHDTAPEATAPFAGEKPVAAIRRDGTVVPAFDPMLSDTQIVSLYQRMLEARILDERLAALQRQGRVGFHIGSSGEEAAILGSACMLEEHDWIFPSYREFSVALMRGMSVRQLLDHMFGNANDLSKGRQMPSHFTFSAGNMVSISSPVGTQITQAVGCAWAARRTGTETAVLTYFGEGTTSSNEFHAAMNFAGVWKAPVILLCRNNGWAISTSPAEQTASQTFAVKGMAYGVPSIRCDGNDALAVAWATRSALERARQGQGPTLIEAVTYRVGSHSSSDDARVYRSELEVAQWLQRDPLTRLRLVLERRSLWHRARQEELEAAIATDLREALAAAERAPPPAPESLFDDVYAQAPPHLARQREALRQVLTHSLENPHDERHPRP